MKKLITPNLVKFSLATIILTVIFRFSLSHFLATEQFTWVLICSVLFGASMFISGFVLGKKDHQFLPIFDIGFRFHLATYVFNMLFTELFFLLNFQSEKESIGTVHNTGLIWGAFLLVHFVVYLIIKKKSIKNLDKNSLFE